MPDLKTVLLRFPKRVCSNRKIKTGWNGVPMNKNDSSIEPTGNQKDLSELLRVRTENIDWNQDTLHEMFRIERTFVPVITL
jgi:hypothetical protein